MNHKLQTPNPKHKSVSLQTSILYTP